MQPQQKLLLHPKHNAPNAHSEKSQNISILSIDDLNDAFLRLKPDERIKFAHDWTAAQGDGQLGLTSSFGVQSILMIDFVRNSGLGIPIFSVDIDDPKYDGQRAYKTKLKTALNIDVIDLPADGDAEKVAAMDKGLSEHFIGAALSGLRASQTANRAGRKFVERNPRNGTVEFRPFLDWPDAKADFYIAQMDEALLHPSYAAGVRSQGGAVLSKDQEKTECGLHVY